jgi:hypothetical protein
MCIDWVLKYISTFETRQCLDSQNAEEHLKKKHENRERKIKTYILNLVHTTRF